MTTEPNTSEIRRSLVRWMVFSLSIAVVPILLRFLSLYVFGVYTGASQVLGDGGLLLIATAICADTISETFAIKNSDRASAFVIMLAGGSFLTSIVCSMLWAACALVNYLKTSATPDVGSLMWLSVAFFFIAVLLGVVTRYQMPPIVEQSQDVRPA